jgi:tetratricopeptide (TPR) repeat protein
MEKGENPSLSFLKGLMREIDDQYGSFKKALKIGQEQKGVFLRHVTSHFESDRISSEVRSQMLPYREELSNAIEVIGESLSEADTKLAQMQDLIADYRSTTLGGDGKSDGAFFKGFPSFVDFLLDCRRKWDHVVVNEQEALERAVQYYKAAFVGGRDISPGNQQIQASYLIAELSRRIGDYDGAREYFNTTIKHGQAFVYENRRDQSRTALARKILELATEQGKANMASLKAVRG